MQNDAFKKIKSTLNRGVTTISVKTSSSLEKVKIKTHIDSVQAEVTRLTAAAGAIAYALWESNDTNDTELRRQFELIRQKKEEIAQLEAECAAIDERDNQILGSLSTEEAPADGSVCPSCGAPCTPGSRFCTSCGYRLQP